MNRPKPAPINQEPLLRLAGVSVRLQGAEVLSDLQWELNAGEHWGVVGDNGAGKSTFLRLLAGELWPEPGTGTRVYEFGYGPQYDAVLARGHFRRVAPELQDQYVRFGWNHTGLEVVSTGIHGIEIPRLALSRAQMRAAFDVLDQLGIGHLAEQRFLEMSSGEQRKVLVARALAGNPQVLLLDEFMDNLDVASRDSLLGLLRSLRGRLSIIFSTHRAQTLPPFVNRVIELDRGRIAYLGPRKPGTTAGSRPGSQGSAGREPPGTAAEEGPQILVENADVYLKGKPILRGLNWRLGPAEQWRISGPNGSGKSTFLRLLYGSLRPALGGRVHYRGIADVSALSEIRQKLGYVSPSLQARHLYDMSVEQCVLSGHERSIGLVRPVSAEERARAEDWMHALGLVAIKARSIRRLSYGQIRLALIARALVPEPQILLLDEPVAGLGPRARDAIERALHRVVARGTQLVAASHEPDWLDALWTHQCELEDGRIITQRSLPA